MTRRSSLSRRVGRIIPIVVAGAVLVGSLVVLLVLDSGNTLLVDVPSRPGAAPTSHQPRGWLIVALGVGTLSLLAWALTERERSRLAQIEDQFGSTHESLERLEQERRELEQQLHEANDRCAGETHRAERSLEAWKAEREFNRSLRAQIQQLQNHRGLLGRHDDIHETVLQLTMQLVEAEKGILLSPRKSGDPGLEVVAYRGFENDPSESALAQRFGSQVLEKDTTIREDEPSDAEKHSPADDEVENLLAIPIFLTDEFSGVLVCANRPGGFAELDDQVLLAVGDHAGAVLQNFRLHSELRNAYLSTIAVLADAIELKDRELRGHSDAVSHYVLAVADRLDFEPDRREALIFASLLHDVGKLGISELILLKPGSLTTEERAVIQLHPRLGYELVRQVPALESIAPAILHHHERFDGDGYPSRLKGGAIPLEARIIAIADTFSAITSDRPYDRSRSTEEACAELERCAGSQFDPEVVQLFTEEVRRRPPETLESLPHTADAEVVHRADGDFKLGGRSFAITDSLTLLYSHRHFHETAKAEVQIAELQNRPFAVIVATLLDISELNRNTGFGGGDDALRIVADLARSLGAGHNGMAFRASGRRIALLLRDVDMAASHDVAGELHTRLLGVAEQVGRVGLGTAVWMAGDDGEQVIDRACRAAGDAVPVSS